MQQDNITTIDVNALPVHMFVKTKKDAKKVCKAKVVEMPVTIKDEVMEVMVCCL